VTAPLDTKPYADHEAKESRLVLAETLRVGANRTTGFLGDIAPLAHTLRAEGFDASEDGTGRGTPIVVSQNGSDVQINDDVGTVRPGMARQTSGPVVVSETGKGWWSDGVSPLRADPGGTPAQIALTTAIPRRLTPTEAERLQGFPDDWTRYADDGSEIADGPRYRMLGNAVSVPVAEWIGRRLLAVTNQPATRER
jgi:DNA (cytosine-5)-methyltransferase 1